MTGKEANQIVLSQSGRQVATFQPKCHLRINLCDLGQTITPKETIFFGRDGGGMVKEWKDFHSLTRVVQSLQPWLTW